MTECHNNIHDIDGIYTVAYTGDFSSGMAIILIYAGGLTGGDMGGATYDGSITPSANGSHLAEVSMTIPSNTVLATSGHTLGAEQQFQIRINLPADFWCGSIIRIIMPVGPVNAKFRLVRKLHRSADGGGGNAPSFAK